MPKRMPPEITSEAKPRQFKSFRLSEKGRRVKPKGKLEQSLAEGKVPKGARIFLYPSHGGTAPFYLYTRRYGQKKKPVSLVLDFRQIPSIKQKEIEIVVEKIGLKHIAEQGRLIVKTRQHWGSIRKAVHK